MTECDRLQRESRVSEAGGSEGQASLQPLLQMIARQSAVPGILAALCRRMLEDDGNPVAFFLLDGDGWTSPAHSALTPRTEAALAAMDPAELSQALFASAATGKGPLNAFEDGWARHLYSGVGELLGVVVGLADGPLLPSGAAAARIESACHLAMLAIEQRNLLAELAFQTGPDVPRALTQNRDYCELSMQRVTQMISRQSEREEILAALCRYAGEAPEERQVAFFLTDGKEWTLAAKGDLTPAGEASLARIEPTGLSEELFRRDALFDEPTAFPFAHGWARHLYSGAGELLGILVGLAERPIVPYGSLAMHIESICRLATLALEQRNLMEEMAFHAEHDFLTGLYNRAYYERTLGWTLREARGQSRRPALVYLDLDRFRLVNDVLGHATGDRLLAQIGRRFQSELRSGDLLARVGGGEFAVLMADAPAVEDAGAVGLRLLQALAAPFSIDGHELFISASMGISRAGRESTPEALHREAYLALRHAKQSGTARLAYFHSSMAATPPERLEMEKRLRFALGRKEVLVYYQPQVDLSTGEVVGAEALIRWRPDGLGIVSPAVFVPILEETGLIVEFGRWVLVEACRQAKEWLDRTGLRLRIGVNVAALQLALPGFVQEVQQALLETGLPPELLELELTESALVGDFAAASRTLRNLQTSSGVAFALDDFGTGQSSLSYLRQLPFQRLKVDQSFVRGMKDGQAPEPLVETILRMAEDLGMSAIAEGVETPHQCQVLRNLRCPEAQGYLFSRPLPPQEFLAFCLQHAENIGSGGSPVAADITEIVSA